MVVKLNFRLNFQMCEGRSWCFHGTNVLLHGCATFLLSSVCLHVLNLDYLAALVAATLFAVHPIHTEAVRGHSNNKWKFSGRGVNQSVTKYHKGVRFFFAKMPRDNFVLVISLEKVNKSLCHVTQGGGG